MSDLLGPAAHRCFNTAALFPFRTKSSPDGLTTLEAMPGLGHCNMHTHVTAPTQFVGTGGIRFAYRRFGMETGVPLVLMPHFRAGMDHWDPAITDGFARDRPVILFDNAGVAATSGETPGTFEAMPEYAAEFISALGLSHPDILGFSIGGYIAQSLALRHPDLVGSIPTAPTI